MALVPPLSKVGDIIVDVVGMDMPIAFREAFPNTTVSPFQLVGCCLLEGMDNVSIEEEPKWIVVSRNLDVIELEELPILLDA
jgi:hypothetical protein